MPAATGPVPGGCSQGCFCRPRPSALDLLAAPDPVSPADSDDQHEQRRNREHRQQDRSREHEAQDSELHDHRDGQDAQLLAADLSIAHPGSLSRVQSRWLPAGTDEKPRAQREA